MKTRIAAWTMFVVCVLVLIGCGGSNASYNPLSPSPPPPPISPPTPPPPSLVVDLTGNYALTFEVGNGCERVPKELRSRTYEARIEYWKSGPTDLFFADLSGSRFHRYHPVLIEVSDNSVFVDLSDNVILEEPSPGAYLATAGVGAAPVPTELSTISGSFRGFFNYCAQTSESGVQNQCSLDAMVRSLCRSENSRWTLTRR